MNPLPPTAIHLRAPVTTDLPQLVLLEQASFSTDRLNARRFRHWMCAQNCHFEVACTADGKIAGYALVLYRRNSTRARLYSIVVTPDQRGNGLARHLLDRCETAARHNGSDTLYLEVRLDNRSAIRLYEKSGYRLQHRIAGFYEDGTDALRLEKPLG